MLAARPKGKARTGRSLSSFLPHAFEIADDCIAMLDGGFLFGYDLDTPDFASLTPARRDQLTLLFASGLTELGDGWTFWFEYNQRESSPVPDSEFPNPILAHMAESRRELYAEPFSTVTSDCALFLRWEPPATAESKLWELVAGLGKRAKSNSSEALMLRLKMVREALRRFEEFAQSVIGLNRMRAINGVSPLLTRINHAICGQMEPLPHFPNGLYCAQTLAREMWMGTYPYVSDAHVGLLSIDGFPPSTEPALLNTLTTIPLPFRWTSRFIMLDQAKAKALLQHERKRWDQASRSFVDQYLERYRNDARWKEGQGHVAEIDEALGSLNERGLRHGYLSATIAVRHPETEVIDEALSVLRSELVRLGCVARQESLNAVEAFLGSIPGVTKANVRRPLLHTLHYLNLLPISTSWAGSPQNPSPLIENGEGDALLRVTGRGNDAFDLNLHVDDLGHTLVFGQTGSGKSVLLAALAYAFTRYPNARVISFDKGQSLRAMTLARGGAWRELGSSISGGFNPLRMLAPDDAPLSYGDQAWLASWVADITEIRIGRRATPTQSKLIEEAVKRIAEPSQSGRSMLALQSAIQDDELRTALSAYAGEGLHAALFDDPTADDSDNPNGPWVCYETDALMELPVEASLPLLALIFHLVDREADGRPTLMLIDEAWAMLSHPTFAQKIREWLKTMRKKNVAVVLATQSLADAVSTGLLPVLAESCPTRIYGANPEATDSAYDSFAAIGASQTDAELVAGLVPKREYLLAVGAQRKIFNLRLTPEELAFCAVSDPESVRDVVAEHQGGGEWAQRWFAKRS